MDDRFSGPLWSAQWIGLDAHPSRDLGFFGFRTSFRLDSVPDRFPVRVSADQRYKLYVNGEMVAFGPQRGDVLHWFFETLDLAPFLRQGENWIAALVWNFGRHAPQAQHTVRLGFVFESASMPDVLNTPGTWRVAALPGLDFEMMQSSPSYHYTDVGPGEKVDGRMHAAGWETGSETQELDWRRPHVVSGAEDRGNNSGGTPWNLVPRSIPLMDYRRREAPPVVRRGFVGDCPDAPLPADKGPLCLPLQLQPGTKVVLDYGELLCAYPRLRVTGKPGDKVWITYAESLWNLHGEGQWWGQAGKPNRDVVEGKQMQGYQDCIVLGEEAVGFEPAWWRTYRYLSLEADGSEPAEVQALDAYETGYPYAVESSFEADHPDVARVWDLCVRTAKRCAGETYFDCPYYEQLQYVGDTRIQALIHSYLSRDRALQRNAVETLGWSLMENGLTQSRYPSRQPQVIPPFSLWWVVMLYDEMLHDRLPDRRWLNAVPRVLEAYERLAEDTNHAFWMFGDWVPNWGWGTPPGGILHPMHQMLLHVAKAAYRRLVDGASGGDLRRPLEEFRTVPPPPADTEHASALYGFLRKIAGLPMTPWPGAELDAQNAARCTYFYTFYKHQAMGPADYMDAIADWVGMVENGMTTCPENPGHTRSDCHAWSAHPVVGFLQWVAGVTSEAVGWERARIEPHPGSLRSFDARVAHPKGDLEVRLKEGRLEVVTPVPATVVWKGAESVVDPGSHAFA
ncbi:MAG: family 78 glycoside hydrolase catalytic domain [Fimbriimonadales bacterium]